LAEPSSGARTILWLEIHMNISRKLKAFAGLLTAVSLAVSATGRAQDGAQVAPPPVLPLDVPDPLAQPKQNAPSVGAAEQEFLQNASELLVYEAEMGRMAAERAKSPDAQALGAELLASQGRLTSILQELAKRKGVSLRGEAGAKQRDTLTALAEREGEMFDAAFKEYAARSRAEAAQHFASAGRVSRDAEIRGFGQQAINELRSGRPLAAKAAGESASKDREIASVALNPEAKKDVPAVTAVPTSAAPAAPVADPTVAPANSTAPTVATGLQATEDTPAAMPPRNVPVQPAAVPTPPAYPAAHSRVAVGQPVQSSSTAIPAARSPVAPSAIHRPLTTAPAVEIPPATTRSSGARIVDSDSTDVPPSAVPVDPRPARMTGPTVVSRPATGTIVTTPVPVERPTRSVIVRRVERPATATSDGEAVVENAAPVSSRRVRPAVSADQDFSTAPRPRVVVRQSPRTETIIVQPAVPKVERRQVFRSSSRDDDDDDEDDD
jgi:putative membrane protein